MLPLIKTKRLDLEDLSQNGDIQNHKVKRERESDGSEEVEVVEGVSVPGEDALTRGEGVESSEHFDGHQNRERDSVGGVI